MNTTSISELWVDDLLVRKMSDDRGQTWDLDTCCGKLGLGRLETYMLLRRLCRQERIKPLSGKWQGWRVLSGKDTFYVPIS